MKKTIFLSSLNNEKQRGGAFLRVDSIKKVIQSWGGQVSILYQDAIHPTGFFQKLRASLIYGKEIKSLFSKAQVTISECDILILDNFRYLHWDFKFKGKRPRIIYNAHNLEFENYFGKFDTPKRRKFAHYEALKMNECDFILVCSEREKDILLNLNANLSSKVFVFPNLVDSKFYDKGSQSSKKWITFLGTLDYFPNIEAVDFICNKFINDLPSDLRSKIVIAGRNPSPKVESLCRAKGITLKTNLSDSEIKKLLKETKIGLVPLMSGSGTRLKIIESLFSDTIVLSTSMGAEGVEEKGLRIAELDEFGRECVDLYQNFNFQDLCTPEIMDEYLNTYDCNFWALQHKEEFANILM